MASVRAQPWVALEADNLTSLAELTEENLLEAIEERYRASLIYTAVGDILVAVNPFRTLPVYNDSWSKAYGVADVSDLAPHIYRVAAAAYNSMIQGKKNQVCVISGESGAGKTESAKFIMKQVMDMCRSAGLGLRLQQKIIQLNPLLEAFGNARTELNDNSSRFGKFIQLLFESNGRIVGAGLEQYLLEKSRVCVQGERERNFHIFYYLYAGLSPEKKAQLYLKNPAQHRYLQTYCTLNSDCTSDDSKVAFSTVLDSMRSIGFSSDEIEQVLTLLAAVLHLGDIEFECSEVRGGDSAAIKNPELVETISHMLHLENSEDLAFALTTLRTMTRGEPVDKLYSCTKAAVVRDATAKAVYARMFQWIISRINTHLQPKDDYTRSKASALEDHLNIGILDIFGFENFEMNSFEQFCINLANEQLQQYFNHQIFAMEKMECAKEGVDDLDITYSDNTPVINLFLGRPIGLLGLLDEQCKGLNGTEKAFVQRCRESFTDHKSFRPHRGNALEFTISHYAGDVTYEIEGFIEKNRDSLPDTVVEALRFTSLRLLGTLFTSQEQSSRRGGGDRRDQLRKSFLRKSQRSVMRAMSQRRRKHSISPKKKQAQRKLLTVSAHFRESLHLLMERLFAASPHFVRCVKPNLQKQPNLFESDFVLRQLRYTGMLEAVRVRREGYSYRPFFSDFVSSYRAVAYPFTEEDVKLTEVTCQVILNKAGLTGWRLARSRVFLRYFHEQKLQLILKSMEDGALLIQKMYRGYSARKRFKPMKEKSRLQSHQVVSMLQQLATDGQVHQPLLKALDRIDILEAPKRFKKRETGPPPESVGPSSMDYNGLSTLQRKALKVQRLGVQVGAKGLDGAALQVALRGQSSPSRSRPPSEIESSRPPPPLNPPPPSTPSEIESSRPPPPLNPPPPSTPSEIESSRPPPPLNPPPPSTPKFSRPPPPLNPPPPSKPPPRYSYTPSLSGDDFSPISLSPSSISSSPSHTSSAQGSKLGHPPPTAIKPTSPRRKPPPRLTSSRPINVTVMPTTTSNLASTATDTVPSKTSGYAPVPKPRKRKSRNFSTGSSQDASPVRVASDDQHRRSSASVFSGDKEVRVAPVRPLSRRPISGAKSLPGEVSSPNKRDDPIARGALEPISLSQDNIMQEQSPKQHFNTESPRHLGHNQEQEYVQMQALTGKTPQSHSQMLSPLYSEPSHKPTEYISRTTPRRALPADHSGEESTLDFRSFSATIASPNSRYMSSSVPDLLDDRTPSSSTPPVSSPLALHTNSHAYPHNVTRARGLASSTSDLIEGPPIDSHRTTSANNSHIINLHPLSDDIPSPRRLDPPPQGDKRKKGWFGFKRVSRKKSAGSENGSDNSPLPSPRRESDTDVLGYYPHLSYTDAVEMVTGQPRGTYVVFKEDLQAYSGQSCEYKLSVSSGREIKMYTVLCTTNGKTLQYQLVNGTTRPFSHPTLKSLVDYYKSVELSDGLTLSQPRLIAGISVTGANIAHTPQMARGRLKGRKKQKL